MSRPETVLSPRSSLSSSPISSASSIDSPLISDSISDWAEHSRDRAHQRGIHSDTYTTTSDSESPMTPWDLRRDLGLPSSADRHRDTSDEDQNQDDHDENNIPPLYLGHTRWKQSQQPHTPGQNHRTLSADHVDRTTLHRRTRSKTKHIYHTHRNVHYERHLSRDFFLILTLCFVAACFLICLTRPALATWFHGSASLLGLDEF